MKKVMRFGDFIKEKRLSRTPKITLKSMSEQLGIALTHLSDIENNRKKPFNKETIELFCKLLDLSEDDKATMYDLAAVEKNSIPMDISDEIMFSEIGDFARKALRTTSESDNDIEAWKKLIRQLEENKKRK